MKRIYLDTNAIINYLTGRNETQTKKVEEVIKRAEKDKDFKVEVLHEVILETYYVLKSFYEIDKKTITEKTVNFINKDLIYVNQKELILEAFTIHLNLNVKILDAILYLKAQENDTEVFSFDEHFKRLEKGNKHNKTTTPHKDIL